MSYNPYVPSNERDTHFQGYAHLLYPELASLFLRRDYFQAHQDEEGMKHLEESIKTLLSQRAYDLVKHALDKANTGYMICPENDIADVPDLTQWPERS